MNWKKILMVVAAVVLILKFRKEIIDALGGVPAIGERTVRFIG